MTKDIDRAREIASELDSENRERQETEQEIFAQALDMIEMVVCHEDGLDGIERQAPLGKSFFDGTRADADVNEKGSPVVAEIVAVAVASARQAQEPHHFIDPS